MKELRGLLGQNQLSLTSLSQTVELPATLDPNLVATAREVVEMDNFWKL